MQGFVLGGTSSGVGKTVATLAVIRALEDAGADVQPAKAGPDFIDPSHHAALTGKPSRTLDVWMQGEEGIVRNYHRGHGDVCVVEGVMGLYDGSKSSTAMVADALDLPVVLVVDAKAGMESVGATALGFREYAREAGRDVEVAGIVAQRAHGGRHEEGIRDALPEGMEFFGRIAPSGDLEIPDRHLGLHMGEEAPLDEEALESAAEHLDAQALLDAAGDPPEPDFSAGRSVTDRTVAVAQDSAFCFVYPATLERLRERAEVVTFAPTDGDALPDCDGVYLPGGYPELHPEELSESDALATLADRASEGLPVVGECGGLMAMCESLTTKDGDTYEMAGILPADVEMKGMYQALDHVELRTTRDVPTADEGDRLTGHEFHYSSADVGTDARFAFEMERGDGIDGEHDGLITYESVGTYCHTHAEHGAFDALIDNL
ncbi:cobyrinic acid a,c-diamide synthase [Haloarculaceae archaeon H-GB2-1]|nr:cobyrinic acid a,c-diamide synthase [Haloarculaceae archaeon H-GB1-1]MEA5387618.1 cobyrinic acid a,c-diamide synthase [Haloarculaceae archaeon H-GB11]MEA5409106.1 cobyrinic acid a,c-diamide synthase [Haloarculaceae archaeon H-GB2-1]